MLGIANTQFSSQIGEEAFHKGAIPIHHRLIRAFEAQD
jgi:hypothetical protein